MWGGKYEFPWPNISFRYGFLKRMHERSLDSTATDEELMERFKNEDDGAFIQLYSRYQKRVYAYCVRMVNSRELAEDLFQDVFIRVSRKRKRFIGGNFSAWLFAITRNLCLNAIRDRPRRGVPIEDVSETLQASGDETEYDESLELLRQAIETLPPDMREPLILRVYDGLSYQEISDLTGTKLATVKVRVFRAKQRLYEILAPYFMDMV